MLKDRLLEFIKSQGLTVSAFEAKVGLSNGAVSRTNENMRRRTLDSIVKVFPQLNETWLLTGKGEMLVQSNAKMVGGTYVVGQKDDEIVMVDFIPVSASASFVESLCGDGNMELDKYPIIPMGNERKNVNNLRIFEVEGDSMYPTILSGSLILAKEIPEKDWHYAEGVVIAIYSEYIVCKRIARNCLMTDNYLVLRSDNESYGEMTIALSDLRGLYKAKRIISSEIR